MEDSIQVVVGRVAGSLEEERYVASIDDSMEGKDCCVGGLEDVNRDGVSVRASSLAAAFPLLALVQVFPLYPCGVYEL